MAVADDDENEEEGEEEEEGEVEVGLEGHSILRQMMSGWGDPSAEQGIDMVSDVIF